MSPKSMGQLLYEVLGDKTRWKDDQGLKMPAWELLSEDTKDGWHAVASKAAELFL